MSYKGWGCGECENYRRGWMGVEGGNGIVFGFLGIVDTMLMKS